MTFAAELAAAARAQGLQVDAVPDADRPESAATVPSVMTIREPLDIGRIPGEDELYFDGWGMEINMIGGEARDLGELARIAHGWQAGVPVAEIHAMSPYSRLGPLALAAEQGPEALVEAGWKYLRGRDINYYQPAFEVFVEAAYAEPVLRRLFPYVGMWTVRFLAQVLPYGPAAAQVDLLESGFAVTVGEVRTEVAAPQEAVALAARAARS